MNRLDNIRRRRPARAAVVLIPTLFAILGPMGVVASPFLSYGKTKLEVAGLTHRSQELRTAVEGDRELLSETARTRVLRACEEIDACIPAPQSPVLMHALVRLLCDRADFLLDTISISAPDDAGLERLDDYIAERRVLLRGKGPMTSLVALPAALETLGFPNIVTAFELSRTSPDEPDFSLALTLSLFESADPPVEEELPDGVSSPGGP
ncbi:MAG TPA: hypothetical protein ENJ09_04710 [Planctomycetes bacterium]|nr:hypothetical protein [Planctomycetota bacterium]